MLKPRFIPSAPTAVAARWKVELAGEREELQALAKMFGHRDGPPRVRVWWEDPHHYLHAPQFDGMTEARVVLEHAELLARRLTGLGRLKFGSFRPVRAGIVVQPTIHGGSGNVFIGTGAIVLHLPTPELSAYLDYTPNRPPVMNARVGPIVAALPPVEEWVTVADSTPDVDSALYLLTVGTASGDWRILSVVYEIVQAHVGQPSTIERLGWATREEIRRFKDTAGSWGALGIGARHGPSKSAPPTNPMTFGEAQELVQRLLREWIRSLAEPPAR